MGGKCITIFLKLIWRKMHLWQFRVTSFPCERGGLSSVWSRCWGRESWGHCQPTLASSEICCGLTPQSTWAASTLEACSLSATSVICLGTDGCGILGGSSYDSRPKQPFLLGDLVTSPERGTGEVRPRIPLPPDSSII